MIPISLNISGLSTEFALNKNEVDGLLGYVVDEVAADFAYKWDSEANVLGKSRSAYKNSIQVEKIDPLTSVVFLNPDNWLANAVETGIEPYDMKENFSKSSKVKYNKFGQWYLTIPFRFSTPDAIADNPVFAGKMPQVIHRLVLQNEINNPVQQSQSGLPFSQIPMQYQIPESSTLRKILKSDPFYKLAEGTQMTSIYSGLKRNDKGSGYIMFRRVGENSADDKFQHPGITARNLADKAISNMDIPLTVDMAVDNFLSNLGF